MACCIGACLFDRSSFLALRSQIVIVLELVLVLGFLRVACFSDMPHRIATGLCRGGLPFALIAARTFDGLFF